MVPLKGNSRPERDTSLLAAGAAATVPKGPIHHPSVPRQGKNVRIALVHDFLFTYGGAERVLSEFHAAFPEAPIYTLFAEPEVVKKHFPKAAIVTSGLQRHPLRRFPSFLLGSMPLAIESFNFNGFDVVLSSSGAFSHGVITGTDTKHVSYCHTPMRYAWDWHHEYLEERGIRSFLPLLATRKLLSRLRLWDAVSAKRVDRFLANSTVVAGRIDKFYRMDSLVVHPPLADDLFDEPLVAPTGRGRYVVTASRLTPNKRIDLIIEACAAAKVPLRIIGDGKDRSRLEALARKAGGTVTFTGYVSETDKRKHIAEARAFIFAAEDDFGIAPAEAMALGTPLVTFGRGGILDVFEDGVTGTSFPEPTAESLAAAIKRLDTDFDPAEVREAVADLKASAFRETISKIVARA